MSKTPSHHTTQLKAVFRSVEGRLFRAQSIHYGLMCFNSFLLVYLFIATVRFLSAGWIPPQKQLFYLFAIPGASAVIGLIAALISPKSRAPYIRMLDHRYACRDSLNAAYEIVREHRNWNEWNAPILEQAARCLSQCKIELAKCIPYHTLKSSLTAVILVCLTMSLLLFARSPSGMALRISRLQSSLKRQAHILAALSDETYDENIPETKQRSVHMQKLAHELRMIARTDTPSEYISEMSALADTIDSLRNGSDNKHDSSVPDIDSLLDDIGQTVDQLAQTAGQPAGTVPGSIASPSMTTKPGQGAGIHKSGRKVVQRVSQPTKTIGSTELVIEKNGLTGTQPAFRQSSDMVSPAATTSVVQTTDFSVDTPVTLHQGGSIVAAGKLAPIHIADMPATSPVWFEAIPADRREHVYRYFSMSSDTREQP